MGKEKSPGGLRILKRALISFVGLVVACLGAMIVKTTEMILLKFLGIVMVIGGFLTCLAFAIVAFLCWADYDYDKWFESSLSKPDPSATVTAKSDEDSFYSTNDEYKKFCLWRDSIEKYIDKSLPYDYKIQLYYSICRSSGREWPEKYLLDFLQPEGWDKLSEGKKGECISVIQNHIADSVGDKGLLRYYYQKECGYTEQQFEDLWMSRGN